MKKITLQTLRFIAKQDGENGRYGRLTFDGILEDGTPATFKTNLNSKYVSQLGAKLKGELVNWNELTLELKDGAIELVAGVFEDKPYEYYEIKITSQLKDANLITITPFDGF